MRTSIITVCLLALACAFAQASLVSDLPSGSVDTCYGHSLKTGADALILKASVPVVKLATNAGNVPLVVTANLDALAWASDEVGNGLGLGASISLAPRTAEAGSLALTGGVGYLSDLGLTVYAGIKLASL